MSILHPFHLAFPVSDLAAARAFYTGVLGCAEGRSDEHWIDFDFFGHQLVAHLVPNHTPLAGANAVDGHNVPVPHFGLVLSMTEWRAKAEQLQQAGVKFEIEPHIRFPGLPGEQGTMFFYDPSGNALEIKGFEHMEQLFAK